MATKSKEVAVSQAAEVSMFSSETPDWAKSGTGRGSEEVTQKDLILPRLEIVQSQSPIKDEDPDALEGYLFNTVTQEVLGDSAYIVPLYYRMEYLVWKDQNKGGGFFGSYDSAGQAETRRAEVVAGGEDPEDIEVVDTPVHYCLRVKPDMTTEQIVISMAKSKAKVSRKWNSMIQLCGGDRFSRVYKMTTFKDKNKQNKTFFNYIVTPAGFPPEAIYRHAETVYGKIRSDGVKADHASGGYGEEVSGANDPEI